MKDLEKGTQATDKEVVASTNGENMNGQRIYWLVNDLFAEVAETDKVREQKEELRAHLADRVNDLVATGLPFDEALEAAKSDLGDIGELTSNFERKRRSKCNHKEGECNCANDAARGDTAKIVRDSLAAAGLENLGEEIGDKIERSERKSKKGTSIHIVGCAGGGLVALSPFVYVGVGLLLTFLNPEWWPFVNWWAWGWAIIPVSAIIGSGGGLLWKIPALSPFIYVVVGILTASGIWWAVGWLIIPASAILLSGFKQKKKKKKKKIKPEDIVEHE